ncbi:MAG: MinD/ParA family protein [Candidatus Nanopelagicales bacterium]|jgi:MinD-like ATPase involved in chromosome partitioning or flagellar assembly|nr:MinD/ParA family protein [Candidatus Nanopelagicales bacterium]MDP4715614.1 MinD/ParA family protein [Candidatus Nanopelagicales bacterium]MDP4906627.1 MinD/ParA family protein [Candidatus Nanopelagicales bacterium]MDP4974951.1 MinD/ParA family protein [Candidatus Nanopelagicales bacterium]MDP5095067.1 MinD/ParA family protein [Candidatus Nanopelagicales bacterium]
MTTVVSIHSFRGGTGKSNSTSNLAAHLAAMGARVAVIDTDIQSPGVHVLFGFDEHMDNTLNDYLWGKMPIEQAAHDVTDRVRASIDVVDGGALYLVPSSMKAGDIARVLREGYDVGTLNDGFRDLARALQLDFLLIDTHPGLNEETLLSITISDVLLLILRPDRQDFQGTAVTVDVARKLGVPTLYLMVNKVPRGVDVDDLREQMTAAYGAETAAILPLSEEVVQNASSGLFSLTQPDHPWSQQIRGVAERLKG